MPEGDTLHRLARVLGAALEGRAIVAAEAHPRHAARLGPPLVGREVVQVEARGKNLLVHLDDETSLWSHLRMTGSWRVIRPGEPWPKPLHLRSLALSTGEVLVVGFQLPVLERLTAAALRAHPMLRGLGPDLLADTFDVPAAVARLRHEALAPLGEALLDQRLASGIGNVYKSEVLFVCGEDPFRRVRDVPDEALARVLTEARAMMRRNLEDRPRRTAHAAFGPRTFVYGREGLPCRTCGAPIEMARQGEAARSTYFCPVCQRASVRGRAHVQSRPPR